MNNWEVDYLGELWAWFNVILSTLLAALVVGGFATAIGWLIYLGIKGENKHTHEIEVFGAPCLGGDYHEYCLKCGWVEPCEIDGESE